MAEQPNYPDILGYITGNTRMSVEVLDAAVAVRPQVARAGRPFETLLLLQNNSDTNVTVTANLRLPQVDAKKQQNRFIPGNDEMTITLRPAEVGYMVLTAATRKDTAIYENYHIGIDLVVSSPEGLRWLRRPVSEPRNADDYYFYLNGVTVQHMVELKSLTFSSQSSADSTLQTDLTLISAQKGQPVKKQPDEAQTRWISLWSLGDHTDARPSLERYSSVLEHTILPQLNRQTLYEPLFLTTQNRVRDAGYPVSPAETHFIVKLLISILDMATQPAQLSPQYPGDEVYYVSALLKRGWALDGRPIPLPNWCRVMLHTIGFDQSVSQQPVRALAGSLYDDLVRDATLHGFKLMYQATSEELGSDDDMHAYANQLIQAMWHPRRNLTFVDVYLPLVLGGILVDERVILPYESNLKFLRTVQNTIKEHETRASGNDRLVIKMADQIIDTALTKYGYHL